MASCETGGCDCPMISGRTYHRCNCWPVGDMACRVDPKALENIDPNYGGPCRADALGRHVWIPGAEGMLF